MFEEKKPPSAMQQVFGAKWQTTELRRILLRNDVGGEPLVLRYRYGLLVLTQGEAILPGRIAMKLEGPQSAALRLLARMAGVRRCGWKSRANFLRHLFRCIRRHG